MKTTLCIERLAVRTHIGCNEEERATPRTLYISVRMEGDFSKAIASDELADTVDYIRVSQDILAFCEATETHLLEHLTKDVIGLCANYDLVERVRVKVMKEYLPIDFEHVGVEMERNT
jgi:FolB domain-containing protein